MTRDELLFSICPGYRTPSCYNGDKSCNCEDCNHILNEWLDEYDKQIIEQYKENTNLKDTIREIHDNVAHEMYCKALDDIVKIIKERVGMDWEWDFYFIEEIAEKLKEGMKNE